MNQSLLMPGRGPSKPLDSERENTESLKCTKGGNENFVKLE